jgi:uncharacterized protein YjbJ (UPF0337 family)
VLIRQPLRGITWSKTKCPGPRGVPRFRTFSFHGIAKRVAYQHSALKARRSGTLRYGSRCTHDKESGLSGRAAFPDEDRIAGTARTIGGKVDEGVGRATDDIKEQVQGKLDQAAGTAQDLYGQTAEVARDTAVTFEKWLRDTIETKPYVAVAVALGIGWLIGRTHRPL